MDSQDIEQPMAPKRRRSLSAVVLVGFVIWMGFMLSELRNPPPVSRAGREMRELAVKHTMMERQNPLAETGALRRRGVR
jgi:hypothetical protein